MRKGPGKGGGTDLTEVAGNSEDATERLATDSGSGIRLAILVLDKVRVVHTCELIVGVRRTEIELSGEFKLLVALR
jgi:hypothetical protein